MFAEEDFLPLSGLQHIEFCERRWALVQLEAIWADNRFTAEGKELHERAHSGDVESRPGVLIRRTLPVHSRRLGLSGQADIVEFQPVKENRIGVVLGGRRGLWRPFPIEYKRSRDKAGSLAYRVQLCAQALCLEEMFAIEIAEGAVYDGKTKRRVAVPFTAELRKSTEALSRRMHALFASRITPPPILKKACGSCSLQETCRPELLTSAGSVAAFYARWLRSG